MSEPKSEESNPDLDLDFYRRLGATLALAAAQAEQALRNKGRGLHCEEGCAWCREEADAIFEEWLLSQLEATDK